MSSRLNEGKVAIVTGAGGGIGREIALALADSGARVVINDIGVSLQGEGGSASPAEETLGLIRQRGGEGLINTTASPTGTARGVSSNAPWTVSGVWISW